MGWLTRTRQRLKHGSSRTPPKSADSLASSTSSSRLPEPSEVTEESQVVPAPVSQVQPDPRTALPRADESAIAAPLTDDGTVLELQQSSPATGAVSPATETVQPKDSLPEDPPQSDIEPEPPLIIQKIARTDTFATLTEHAGADRWTAAFAEALAGLDEVARGVVMANNVQDIRELFSQLDDAESTHMKESTIRKGMSRLRVPLSWLDAALSAASPFVALEPAASTAFGIARGVTTLAIGICGVEARLSGNIKQMLEQIEVIDDCDTATQAFESKAIHNALVTVYTDLLTFYCSATEILSRQATMLALLSEQLNERLPPLMDNYVNDSKLLNQHIKNATDAILSNIKEMLIDEKVRTLLGAHRADATKKRHAELSQSIAKDACEWILTDPAFKTWLTGCGDAALPVEKRILAVFGDMGCGKTTTMAYLVEYIGTLYSSQVPRVSRAYYYINSDGTGRPLEVYLSLIVQFMDQKKFLKVLFDRWDDEQREKGILGQTQDPLLLSQFLIKAIKAMERPLFIFVDGLDECRDSVGGGANHILSVLQQCAEASPLVRICVSARNHQHIKNLLSGNLITDVPRAATRDSLIVKYLVEKRLAYLNPQGQAIVVEGLSKLADGSAIWVSLAVELLAKRKIQALRPLKAFIDEIPGITVLGLYAKLYGQVTEDDPDNCRLLSIALEILAVTERPMSIAELSWAVALVEEDSDGYSGSQSALCVNEVTALVDPDRLLGFLYPFIVITNFSVEDEQARQVHLNHHSVREHVLQSPPDRWTELAANPMLARSLPQNNVRPAELHGRLGRQCVRYLLMDEFKSLELFTQEDKNTQVFDGLCDIPFAFMDDEDSADEAEHGEEQLTELAIPPDTTKTEVEGFYEPAGRGFGHFFVYASCYWLEHMHKADIQVETAPDGKPLTGAKPPICLSDVLRLAEEQGGQEPNWWKQFYRPDCTVKEDESSQRPACHDFLTLLSLYGSDSQLREAVRHEYSTAGSYDDTVRRLSPFRNAIAEILRIGDPERLPLLLPYERGRDLKEVADLFSLVLEHWARDQRQAEKLGENSSDHKYEPVFDHMLRASELLIEQNWGNELLCIAAGYGCLPFIRRLFGAADQSPALREEILRCPDRQGWDHLHQSVGSAAWHGHTSVVEYLLDQDGVREGHLRYRSPKGDTVLHQGARGGDVQMLRMLCEALPEAVSERRKDKDTPLQVLVFSRRPVELVAALLESGGADVRCSGDCCGDVMVGPNGELSDWHEPLRMAARYKDSDLCRTLLQSSGRHDLIWVVAIESKDIAAELRDELGLK